MKIVYDARYTRIEHPDGLTRYGASLMAELAKHAEVQMLINDERQLAHLPDLPWHQVNAPTSPAELWVARKVNKLQPDVVICPLQTMGSAGRKYALILTCQDLIYYSFPTAPGFLPAPVRWIWYVYHHMYWPQRLLLNRPEIVATISNTTRSLMQKFRFTTKPVRLVSNAPQGLATPRAGTSERTKSLVYMGSFMPYKNVETIMAAANELADYQIHLLSGIDPARESQLRAIAPEAVNVVFHHGVSDQQYQQLTREATALVSLSKAEGFGLPLIESMQLGTPVIVADTEIFREVGGDAAQYVPAEDPQAFAAAVRTLENDELWLQASEASRARAADYTWENSAQALYQAAEEALVLYQLKQHP